jgi:competence protein ComEA
MFCANFTKFVAVPLSCVVLLNLSAATHGQLSPPKTVKTKTVAKAALDLNKATAEELEADLPGVGPATAKKIIAGRPYTNVDDLSKAGVSKRVIDAIRSHVTVGAAMADTPRTTRAKTAKAKVDVAQETPTGKVNINTATAAALEDLPGIGAATAKAIIDGRPWKSIDDLTKIRGLGENRMAALKGLVTAGDEPASAPAAAKTASTRSAAAKTPASATETKAMPKLQPGQKVDINTASKDELDVLPGIGPVKAQAIIDGRPFKTIDDIKNVKGIKDGEFAKIKDMITVK